MADVFLTDDAKNDLASLTSPLVLPTGTVDMEQLLKEAFRKPRRLVDEFPLGPSHKVLKRELRRTVAEGA